MKQTRKNKTNQVLNMPKTPYYTLIDLFGLNGHFNASITIRVRHSKLIEDGKVVEIGSLTGGKGRPQKVFSMTPVSQATLNKAKAENINLVDNADKLVNVINVSTPSVVNPATSKVVSSTSQN